MKQEIKFKVSIEDYVKNSTKYVEYYEVFAIYFLLKWLNKDFDKTLKFSPDSVIDTYRALYKPLKNTHNPNVAIAFGEFEDYFNREVDVNWQAFLNLFDFDSMTNEEFEMYFDQLIQLAKNRYPNYIISPPKEITELMTSVYPLIDVSSVYNPFANTASLANYLPKNSFYSAVEKNKKEWALGILNLSAHNRLDKSDFICLDPANDSRREEKFDFIISTVPFGQKKAYTNLIIPNEVDGESIYFAIRQLGADGKAVFLTSLQFLFNSNQNAKALRKDIIDRDILEYVVLLPSKLFSYTSIPSVALFFNNSPSKKSGVTFIDASNYIIPINKKEHKLDSKKLLELIVSKTESESKKLVLPEEIAFQDYNFNVKRYLLAEEDLKTNDTVVSLSELVMERTRERAINQGTVGKFIRIRDLKEDILYYNLNLSEIEVSEIPTHAYEIKAASLLIALRFKSLKPTLLSFNDANTSVFLSNDILSLRVNEEMVDVAYLIAELSSDFVQKQVAALQYGINIPSIKRKDVLNLKIRLPNRDDQRKAFNEKLENHYLEKAEELKTFRDKFNLNQENFKGVASLKHSLGRPLLNIGAGILMIGGYIEQLQDKVLKKQIVDLLNSMNSDLSFASNLLDKNEGELKVGDYQLDEINIISFLKEYIKKPTDYSYRINPFFEEEIEFEFENSVIVKSNLELLTILFNNICDNVDRHAFKKQVHQSNEMYIHVGIDKDDNGGKIVISLSNNGMPFPENFDKNKFIQKNSKAGETGNTGIGGDEINRIVNYFDGTFDLRLNETNDYPTIYEIEFPIIINNISEDEDL